MSPLKMMGVFAHPDDESLAAGGLFAKYAAEGVETFLVCATKGEAGRYMDGHGLIPKETLGHIRAQELRAASRELGVRETFFLDWNDGQVDQVDPHLATQRIVEHIRLVRPDVIVTFGPEGLYGHPDHVAISQLTTAAVMAAADPRYLVPSGRPAHATSKLYYLAWSEATWDTYQAALKRLVMQVDGVERSASAWPEWAITTVVDTEAHSFTARRAVACHRSQVAVYEGFNRLPNSEQAKLWRRAELIRAMSTVNGGRQREADLFEGLGEEAVVARVA